MKECDQYGKLKQKAHCWARAKPAKKAVQDRRSPRASSESRVQQWAFLFPPNMSSPIPKPNYTQVPNVLLDNMHRLSDAELRVLLCICRQTFGWQRGSCKVSTSFIAKATGMSAQGVLNGVQKMLTKGVVARQLDGQSFSYWIVFDCDGSPINGVDRSGVDPINGVERQPINGVERSAPEPINGVDTKKERLKKREKKAALPAGELGSAAVKIYELYPKRVGRPKAIDAILKQLKSFPAEKLEAATRRFALEWNGANGDFQFCPNPTTWFNQERFNDDPSTWRRKEDNNHRPFSQPI